MTSADVSENANKFVIPPELLRSLEEYALQLESSNNLLEHHWGLHLLEDLKSLRLLNEVHNEGP